MKNTNRPWGLKQIIDNFSKDKILGKKIAESCLEKLVSENVLKSKIVNKQSLYWISQSKEDVVSEEEMKQLDSSISVYNSKLLNLHEQISKSSVSLQALNSTPKDDDLQGLIDSYEKQKVELKENLEPNKVGNEVISDSMKSEVQKSYKSSRESWLRRKRIFSDIQGALVENMGKSKFNSLKEELGIEADPIPYTDDKTSKLMSQNNISLNNATNKKQRLK